MSLAGQTAEIVQRFRKREEEGEDPDWYHTKQQITDLFLEEDWDLPDKAIREEVNELFGFSLPSGGKDELEEYFEGAINDLRTESRFTAYVYFPRIVELPVGTKIGDLEIIDEPVEQEEVIEHINSLIDRNELYEGRSWGKIEFDLYNRKALIREMVFRELQIPTSILKVCLSSVGPPENIAGAIFGPSGDIWFLSPRNKPRGITKYDPKYAEPFFSDLSSIAEKDTARRSPLEERILNALQLLDLHSLSYRPEHSFLTLISALEGLLVGKYENPKGTRMAEKVVYLLCDDMSMDKKMEQYSELKEWYETRSDIVHGGFEPVTQERVWRVEDVLSAVIKRLVELTDEYHSIVHQGGENNPHKGLDDLFLEKRLGK